MLLIMDTGNDGKISKPRIYFMGAEFDRLDRQKTGEIDQEEMRQPTVYANQARFADLGR